VLVVTYPELSVSFVVVTYVVEPNVVVGLEVWPLETVPATE